jgi:hypothetical protein
MSPARALRVFVSSTSEDLIPHRDVVRKVIVERGHIPVMMENFGALAASTVTACRQFVASSDVVIALCAFRRGWVPKLDEGGDGEHSITALELETARWLGKTVYLFLAHKSWPGDLYEEEQAGRDWVKQFRAKLNQPAGFFYYHVTADGAAPDPAFRLAIKDTLIKHGDQPPRPRPAAAQELEHVLPLLETGVRAAPQVTAADLVAEYRRAAPRANPTLAPVRPVEAAYVCAADLADAPRRPDGTVPLLEFVRSAARLLLPTHAAPLVEWADNVAGRLGEATAGQPVAIPAAPRPDPAPRRPEVLRALKVVQPALETAVRAAPDLTAGALWLAYEAAAPLGWMPQAEFQTDPVRAADEYGYNLAPAPAQASGAYPLLTFARALLARVPVAQHQPLADAVRDAGRLLDEPDPLPDTAHPTAATPRPDSLLISVWAHRTETDKYTVKGWLGRPLLEDGPYTSDELASVLPSVIARLYREVPKSPDRTERWVEVFLPCELVSEQVDQWEVPVGRLKAVLGCENPVLIRAADLYYDGDLLESRRILEERWGGVKPVRELRVIDQLPPPHPKPEFVYRPAQPWSGKGLRYQLVRDRAVLGVVFQAPPSEDVLDHLLHVGVPVVAWSRGCPATAADLVGELDQKSLADLPARIRDLRVRADLDPDPARPERSVVVLYDDPTRPPPDVLPLETPESI